MEFTEQEIAAKMESNLTLIEGLIKIRNKRGILVPFTLNKAQSLYYKRKTRRNLILKARQEGISKIIDADQLVDCIKYPTIAVVISHEKEATKRLFASVRAFIEHMTVQPTTSIDSKSEIQFPTIPSSYFIGTAGQRAFGRGDTVQRAHLSEAAFYDNLERIRGGIEEAAELGQIDIETTPNGREQFYDMWQKAKKGLSSYTPIFIPWFINREYSSSNLTEKERAGLSPAVQEMFDMPDETFLASLTDEERRLVARVIDEYGIQLTAGELKWRRYKIWDKGALFWQEYPEDDVSCFLQSGRSVFSNVLTDQTLRIPLDDLEKWKATDAEKKALQSQRLFAGVDGAEGTLTGDSHCFAVIHPQHPRAPQGKGAVIYELHSNEPIEVFCSKVAKICKAFNIQLYVEKNGVGNAHCLKFRSLDVRFSEFNTTGANRPTIVTDLEELYRKQDLIETYPEAENEALDMVYAGAKADHQDGKHDDRVFARILAVQAMKMPAAGVSWV
jgi:hypothetical protein